MLNGDAECDRIAAAIELHSRPPLVGVAITPGSPIPSTAWYFKSDGAAFNLFLRAHPGLCIVLMPEDRSLAVLGDGDAIAVAGPAGFVRDALGDIAAARRHFEHERSAEERLGRPGWLLDIVEHYRPFMLDTR